MMREVMVGQMADFPADDCRVLAIDGVEVGIFKVGDRLVAYENRCPHMGGPVCQGKLINRVDEVLDAGKKSRGLKFAADRHVVCPWHGYEFNLETGAHPGSAKVRLRRFEVEVRAGSVFVQIPDAPTKVGVPIVRSLV
jgi:nitrite reductase/ring-hydroxylating ferredoxin subunit